MRIALIVTSPMSANLFLLGFACHLDSSGHTVFLVCGDNANKVSVPLNTNIEVVTFKMTRNPNLFSDLGSFWNMFFSLKKLNLDIALYATPKASFLASIATLLLGIRIRIYALWGLRFETAKGVKRNVLRLIEKATCWLSTSVLANSFSLAEKAIDSSIISKQKITVLGSGSSHGVDLDRFTKSAVTSAVDPGTLTFLDSAAGVTIGFVGRLHPDKGIDTLMDAVCKVIEAGTSVKILIVGPNEGFEIRDSWSNLPVFFAGEQDDVRPYIKAMDFLVLMSLREGFPNVVLEAAALEVPSIVSDTTGCIDSVIDGHTGVIVPVGDVEKLARIIVELASDEKMREQLGVNARERIIKEFDKTIVINNLVNYLMVQMKAIR